MSKFDLIDNIEEWRPVVGYEGLYSISSLGRVRAEFNAAKNRWKAGRILSAAQMKTGYWYVLLTKNGIERHERIHRLVCAAFHGKPSPEKTDCNHKDGDISNNRESNLEWCTRSENMRHAIDVLGRNCNPRPQHGVDRYCAKLTDDKVREIRCLAETGLHTHKDIVGMYGVSRPVISKVIRRENWNHVV